MSHHHLARALHLSTAHRTLIFVLLIALSFALNFVRHAIAQPVDVSDLVPKIGVNLGPINDSNRARYNIPSNILRGAVITAVAPNTDAEAKGLQQGDVIIQVGYEEILTPNNIPEAFSFS